MPHTFRLAARYQRWVDWFSRHGVEVRFSWINSGVKGPRICDVCKWQDRCQGSCQEVETHLRNTFRVRGASKVVPKSPVPAPGKRSPLENAIIHAPCTLRSMELDMGQEEEIDKFTFLTELQREHIRMRCFRHMTFLEIGRHFGKTKENAWQHFYAAKKKIAKKTLTFPAK